MLVSNQSNSFKKLDKLNILNWTEFEITDIQEQEHDYLVNAQIAKTETNHCPHCYHREFVGFGRRKELIMDTPIHGKRTGINLNRRRFRCKSQDCSKTFLEPVPYKDDKRQMTERLMRYIERESLSRAFLAIGDEVGVNEKTIRNIFTDYCERMGNKFQFETPRWLGIDEIYLIKPRCVITNIEHKTMVDLLVNRNKKTVSLYLSQLPDRERIEYVTMDMWRPYYDSVANVLPDAKVIVDKFHVVRMANQCLEKARKAIRADLTTKQRRGLMRDRFVLLKRKHDLSDQEEFKLSGWTLNYPLIGAAYEIKESFYEIWNSGTRAEAEQKYQAWRSELPTELRQHFGDLVRAVDNWHEPIFNYFDHSITNAYTESLNNLIRATNRLGRGYSFEALRAKILFTEGYHKVKKPKFNRRPNEGVMERGMPGFGMYQMPKTTNYGVDISTLEREFSNDDD